MGGGWEVRPGIQIQSPILSESAREREEQGERGLISLLPTLSTIQRGEGGESKRERERERERERDLTSR